MKYLLDTTTISDYLRGNQNIINHFRVTSFKVIFVSSITKFEVEYGMVKNIKARKLFGEQLELLYSQIGTIYFDDDCAKVAAKIKNQLFAGGTPVATEDLLIGAIALNHGLTVVTSNTKHFKKIPDLKIVDWQK